VAWAKSAFPAYPWHIPHSHWNIDSSEIATQPFLKGTTMVHLLAQSQPSGTGVSIGVLVYLAVIVLCIVGMWKVFTKAGQPGWASIIPIYNLIVLLQIAGKPLWWVVLFFIPIANIIVSILMSITLAEKFGKGVGFGIGLAFLGFIFFPILGFGDARYSS
jgi:uncharacterized protein DUF5684